MRRWSLTLLAFLALPLGARGATTATSGGPVHSGTPIYSQGAAAPASRPASFDIVGMTPTFSPTPDGLTPTASPTFSPTPPATAVPTPASQGAAFGLTYTAAVDFNAELPGVPTGLQVDFSLDAGKPMANLGWKPGLATTYMIRGFRVLRKESKEADFKATLGAAQPVALTYGSESVEVGKIYDYRVQAVDAKGNSSLPSSVARLDLLNLDPSRLAPRQPQGVTASSYRDYTKLGWSAPAPWYEAVSTYSVFRDKKMLQQGLTLTSYLDLSPTPKTPFLYQIMAIDISGRKSALSLTATAQATGTLSPSAPRKLTVVAKTEKITLNWDSSLPGTAAVSDYLLRRITEPGAGETGEEIHRFSPLDLSRTSFSESVEGNHYYRYELQAKDYEGNSSTVATVRTWVEAAPFNKTALLLMPTAYSNNSDRDTGLNANVLFDYFVGSLYYSYFSQATDKASAGVFRPLQVGSITTDLKASMVPETSFSPALAVGFYGAALINFGSSEVSVSSGNGGFTTLGDIYAVASKRFGPQSAIHFGYMRGNLANDLVAGATAVGRSSWEPTIRHLMPSQDYPQLLDRLVTPEINVYVEDSPHMFFGGIQFPFTVPLGFTRWKTGLKAEFLAPIFSEDIALPQGFTDKTKAPMMFNFHLDNLPLFGFEFSLLQFQGGWEWIAFYHIPDLTWSW